jgi:mannonate dehydratase
LYTLERTLGTYIPSHGTGAPWAKAADSVPSKLTIKLVLIKQRGKSPVRIAMTVVPYAEETLRAAKQLGVDHIVYNGEPGRALEHTVLRREVDRLRALGLKLTILEGAVPIDRIVLGKEGRESQLEEVKRSIDAMGRLGVEVLCYNFMPAVLGGEMVVRTGYDVPARGGAETSMFRLADVTADTVPHKEKTISIEKMWDNLEYFLRAVIPAAELAGVKLAMHPDDPPLSPICGLNRIMSSVGAFDRLLSLSSSPVNGITLCQGCFLEMGADLPTTIRRFKDRIHFVHFRDVAGTTAEFVETFPDDGPTDFISVFETFKEIGCDAPVRVDHVPRLAVERGPNDGYGFIGHAYATGYLKGLLDSVFGKPGLTRWRETPAQDRARRYLSGEAGRKDG